MIKINGVAVAAPKSFEVTVNDLDGETNRNAYGEMVRDRIAVKRKLNCEWGILSNGECSALLKAVQDVFFTVEFPDPMEGIAISKVMYVGDRSLPMIIYKDEDPLWQGLKMNFIER